MDPLLNPVLDQKFKIVYLGARKLRNLGVDGVRELAMWDRPYETMTNQIIIAFDLDDGFSNMNGFKLK